MLTSRQRVEKSLNHQEADRVPLDLGSTPFTTYHLEVAKQLNHYYQLKEKDYEFISFSAQVVRPHPKIRKLLNIDTYGIFPGQPDGFTLTVEDNSFVDEWGIKQRKMPHSYQYDFVDHPLKQATVEDLKYYPWPDPRDPGRFRNLLDATKNIYDNTDLAIVLNPPQGSQIRELGAWLTGYEKHFMDIIANKRFVEALSDILLDWHKAWIDEALSLVGEYISVIVMADDLGIQTGPIFNPDHYRELYKPYHKELISFIKARTRAKIFYHCCGSIETFIPDLIEIGVDILNPIQVSAKTMVVDRLKKEYGKDIVFWGAACDSQHTLPFRSKEEVCDEVKNTVTTLKRGGGYIFAPIHNILPDISNEKVLALYSEAYRHGFYKP